MLGFGLGRFGTEAGRSSSRPDEEEAAACCWASFCQIFPVELAARLQQVGAPLGIRLSQASELVFRLLCQADGSYIIPFFHQSCGLGHQPQRLQVHVRWILLCPGGGGHGAGHIRPLGQKGHGAAGQGQSKGNAKGERSHHGEKLCLHTAHRPESQE